MRKSDGRGNPAAGAAGISHCPGEIWFFRTADAFGIEHIALCGISATPPNREIHKTALGSELSVGWSYYPTTTECVEKLRNEGYQIIAIEQIEGATMLD